jgi:DNA helicase HerA-like ATPase
MSNELNFDNLRDLSIGTIDFVSPTEWKVLLDINAPQNTAINTGTPTPFPKVNGFVLIPCENGALVSMISWIGIEHSKYPKRKGFKDFDLIDLPYPLRKMSINPLGLLKNTKSGFEIERGVYNYPSVGDIVILPTQEQLQAIVENRDDGAQVIIGESPVAANAPVYVNPDRLFGRHLAILGNTGSGKSCSVAGLIRWSIEEARKHVQKNDGSSQNLNARFIILDPNGEYTKTFDDLTDTVRKFRVKYDLHDDSGNQLRVPAWMWNSYEWSSITSASGKTQRPILRLALRQLRIGTSDILTDDRLKLRRFLTKNLGVLTRTIAQVTYKEDATKIGNIIESISKDLKEKEDANTEIVKELSDASNKLHEVANRKYAAFSKGGKIVEYYKAFEEKDIHDAATEIRTLLKKVGGILEFDGPNEDSPVFFDGEQLPDTIDDLAEEKDSGQFLDYLTMRIRTMLSDSRMASIIGTTDSPSLDDWLSDYVGSNDGENGEIALIDLSLVPTDVIHLVMAVISRIIFEAVQRYRRMNMDVLPTVMVLEEAHTFIKRYSQDGEEISPQKMCCQTFEKIAREGRKFGLGLLLSSQRPSELSPTVLSQCNTFLLHRLVNDRDQELVKKLVPDNLGSLLGELPVLPTRKAILLGWASPIPLLVEMKWLKSEHRPQSSDPDFWDVWTRVKPREIDWKQIVDEWQRNWSETKGKDMDNS